MKRYCINCNHFNKKDLRDAIFEYQQSLRGSWGKLSSPTHLCKKLIWYEEEISVPMQILDKPLLLEGRLASLDPFTQNRNNNCEYYDDRSLWQKIKGWFE